LKAKIPIVLGLFFGIGAVNLPAKTALFNRVSDMFNQVSIKPQERGGMRAFPIGTVSTDGRENQDPANRFNWMVKEIDGDTSTANPNRPMAESPANGKLKYDTYCGVCHGDTGKINEEGFADTSVNKLGMIAPALITLTPHFTDGYIFNKIKYGGAVMPSLGYATTAKDRWDIVNYIRELEKKHESKR